MKNEWKAPEISCLNVKDTKFYSTGGGSDSWHMQNSRGIQVDGHSSPGADAEDMHDWLPQPPQT